eukprot:399714_1
MSLFSCFEREEEHLIFETRLHIKNIFMQQSGGWIGKSIMDVISLYDLLAHGNNISFHISQQNKTQKLLLRMIECLMKNQTYTESKYVNNLIKVLVEQNNTIWLNVKQIMSLTNKELINMFIIDDGKAFGEFTMYLKQQFKIVVCPIFNATWVMNDHTFDVIKRSTDHKYKNQKVVVAGPTIKCDVSDDKSISIVFQPKLTKIEDIYDVEMKLISTHNNEQIKVHFDVNWMDLENQYYTSLHPRVMDIKWNNTFHVILPADKMNLSSNKQSSNRCCNKHENQSDEPKHTLSMSIMVHNVDVFNINDDTIKNLIITADMTASAQSYTFPDMISNFYGISNSVISVMDSISDIWFIVYLYSFSEIQNYKNDEFETTEKITNFL